MEKGNEEEKKERKEEKNIMKLRECNKFSKRTNISFERKIISKRGKKRKKKKKQRKKEEKERSMEQ